MVNGLEALIGLVRGAFTGIVIYGVALISPIASAEDVVVVRTGATLQDERVVRGEIVDETKTHIRILFPDGTEEVILKSIIKERKSDRKGNDPNDIYNLQKPVEEQYKAVYDKNIKKIEDLKGKSITEIVTGICELTNTYKTEKRDTTTIQDALTSLTQNKGTELDLAVLISAYLQKTGINANAVEYQFVKNNKVFTGVELIIDTKTTYLLGLPMSQASIKQDLAKTYGSDMHRNIDKRVEGTGKRKKVE